MDRNDRSNVTMKRGFPRTKHQPVWIYLQGSPCRSWIYQDVPQKIIQSTGWMIFTIWKFRIGFGSNQTNTQKNKCIYRMNQINSSTFLAISTHIPSTTTHRCQDSCCLTCCCMPKNSNHLGMVRKYTNRRNTLEIIRKEMSKNISLVHTFSF